VLTIPARALASLGLALSDYRAPGDLSIFEALNRGPHPWIDQVMILMSERTFDIAAALLAAVLLVVRLKRRALPIIVLSVAAIIISDLGAHRLWKPLFARVRPCYALLPGQFRQLAGVDNSGSLPSSHASNSFAFAMLVALCYPPIAPLVLPVAGLIAISRVFVGVHWPTDVLAGAVWGSLVALALVPLRRPLSHFLQRYMGLKLEAE
jgi:undecaprenyl-diphosphatase